MSCMGITRHLYCEMVATVMHLLTYIFKTFINILMAA